MTTNLFEERLAANAASFVPVVPFETTDKLLLFDFTEKNTTLTEEIFNDTNLFIHYINDQLQKSNARYGIGGYNETRNMYSRSPIFSNGSNEEPRRLHLGIDIWGKPHTKVMAPLDGIVHSFAHNEGLGDYGATIILTHQLDGEVFHTLYGHLSLNSIRDLSEGEMVKKGDVIGEFGPPSDNGQWPPHLHFQVIKDLEGMKGNYPGVCKVSEKDKYLANCPDADLIASMMKYAVSA